MEAASRGILLFLLGSLQPCLVTGHVALTFPPARHYDLDDLDTAKTITPCGMLKESGDKAKTTLVEAGKDLRVTWHMGALHMGGFRLELLDSKENKLMDLTPRDEYVGGDSALYVTTQEYAVSIPENLECSSCIIRLTLQKDLEHTFQFQSCADINIVPANRYSNNCSGKGTLSSLGYCSCQKTFFGDHCQYKNDCEGDSDCGDHGHCLNIGGTSLPHKECYCKLGFYGQKCEKASVLKSKIVNETDYEVVKLKGNDFKFMWRFVNGNEVEGVVIANTTSYVGIGWKPYDISKSCQEFPFDAVPTTSSQFHAMDCQDIIVAKVKDDLSSIGDFYTRDRSTPRRDAYFGGEDDLTAATGWEEDGVTTFMFRKAAARPGDSRVADHDFSGRMTLIWAHGQSGHEFYNDDELKIHGGNRGQKVISVSSLASTTSASLSIIIIIAAASTLFELWSILLPSSVVSSGVKW